MSDKKMILVVVLLAALGIGIVLYMNKAPSKPVSTSNSAIGLGGSTLAGLFSLAGKAFGSGKNPAPSMSSSSASGSNSFFPTVNSTDTTAQQDYATSHGVTDLEGNQIIDQNTGNALVYGTD